MNSEHARRRSLTDAILEDLTIVGAELSPGAGSWEPGGFGLHIYRCDKEISLSCCFDKPLVSLVLQGRKLIQIGGNEYETAPGTMLVNCIDTLSVCSIAGATPQTPFLSLFVFLDRSLLADLLLKHAPANNAGPCSKIWVAPAQLEIADAFRRLAYLAQEPEAADALAPLIMRELHYHLLLLPQGRLLRDLYMNGGRDKRITDTIAWMRENVAVSLAMEDLARMAHMSVSSFHRHFKEITGLSPLQYHKKLRLYEAQKLMLVENQRAAEAALNVGYESVTQFSREYRRMFGEPPGRDIASRKRRLVN